MRAAHASAACQITYHTLNFFFVSHARAARGGARHGQSSQKVEELGAYEHVRLPPSLGALSANLDKPNRPGPTKRTKRTKRRMCTCNDGVL